MSSFSVGDLAQTFMLQRRGAALKTDMARLNEELATGQVSDVKSVLAGNVSYLSDIESDLRTLKGFGVSISEATQYSDSVQTALQRMSTSAQTLSSTLLSVSSNAVGPVLDQISQDAEVEFASLVSALNTNSGGRSLFAGNATDQPAVVSSAEILAELRTATSGLTSTQDIVSAVDTWFSDVLGFEASAYSGGADDVAPFRLADGETVSVQLKADDEVFRNLLKSVATAAIASDASFGLSEQEQRDLLADAGSGILKSQEELTATQASVGAAQARIEEMATRNATQETALEYAKGALLQADPYETATELEAVQFQLQSLYAITARMSDLSFVNFIR